MDGAAEEASGTCPRILIVAEHASAQFGGEAVLPLHYYRFLKMRDVDVRLLVHGRTRDELEALLPDDQDLMFIDDTWIDRLLYRASTYLPDRLAVISFGYLMRLRTQRLQRHKVKELVAGNLIDVIHQPMPVSPREPSILYGLDRPVVIGPMNGGMTFPPAFSSYDSAWVRGVIGLGRTFSSALNRVFPGKPHAAALLVANERTEASLPCKGRRVIELVENGVDLSLWEERQNVERPTGAAAHFVFMGRLVDWKAVDILLHAFAIASRQEVMRLTILGDGDERSKLEELARQLGIDAKPDDNALLDGKAVFAGWQPQAQCVNVLAHSDALVLPSLYECGGAVVLEAMAMGRPVVATNWGGPADYLDSSCGILVDPESRDDLINGIADGMLRLAASPDLCRALGAAGHKKVLTHYNWTTKIDRMIEIYNACHTEHRTGAKD